MTRILERADQGPLRLSKKDLDDEFFLCRCGLSANGIFCDGSHKRTRDEPNARLVRYVREGDQLRREDVQVTVAPTAETPAPEMTSAPA